ncbi:MAG TPA: cupin domain-containing protein [Stellaceae bacterium]|nr:cupin domain-containing protein [Stellaceae bacterium]
MVAKPPVAVVAASVTPNAKPSAYPEPYYSRVLGRQKRPLGDGFGLKNFGVNLTRLMPGAISALRHAHSTQDEFIYILEGAPVLVTDAGETPLKPGMCAGFKAGSGDAHHLVNRTTRDVIYLEFGDRNVPDEVAYPDDDIRGTHDAAGKRIFLHKNGQPFD